MPAILEALRNAEEDEIIALLLRVLNVIGGREAGPNILPLLDHENPMIRRLAIETLGEIVDPRSADYLLAKLDDADVASQQAAVNAISAMVAAFPEIKPQVLAKIRRLLQNPSVPMKLNSLSVFVNIQGEGYHDELLLASKDSDPVIRQKAVSLMGMFSEERFADAARALARRRSDGGAPRGDQRHRPASSGAGARAADHRRSKTPTSGFAPPPRRRSASIAIPTRSSRSCITSITISRRSASPRSRRSASRATSASKSVLFDCAHESDLEVRRAAILSLGARARRGGLRLSDVRDDGRRLAHPRRGRDRAWPFAATAPRCRRCTRALRIPTPTCSSRRCWRSTSCPTAQSFPHLFRALENSAILDEVSDLFVRHKQLYRDLLEEAWRTADSRREVVIAAILQAMKGIVDAVISGSVDQDSCFASITDPLIH